jgi:AmmeMemoRadiSam system protein B
LVTPHIDYQRGGLVYARVWKRAAQMVRAAQVVVVLGTDHLGRDGQITLTRQSYSTPFGVLPTAQDVVDALEQGMGAERAFAEELHHRSEHSIELAAVWLHHIRGGQPCELVPILCGSFDKFLSSGSELERHPEIGPMLRVLRETVSTRRAIVVAAGDLSHIGPAFGGRPVDFVGRARLRAFDDQLIHRVCEGDPQGFLSVNAGQGSGNNVCGVSVIYLALQTLSPVRGEQVAYDLCPADERGTSLVSICGLVLR